MIKVIDRLLIILIIMMLAVNTLIDTIGNQNLEDTVQKTDLIARCLDPTSDCAKLVKENDRRERAYLEQLMKITNICVLKASRQAPDATIEGISRLYDECVLASSPPPPVPVTQNETD